MQECMGYNKCMMLLLLSYASCFVAFSNLLLNRNIGVLSAQGFPKTSFIASLADYLEKARYGTGSRYQQKKITATCFFPFHILLPHAHALNVFHFQATTRTKVIQ